jgi:hypothetical protein
MAASRCDIRSVMGSLPTLVVARAEARTYLRGKGKYGIPVTAERDPSDERATKSGFLRIRPARWDECCGMTILRKLPMRHA